MQQTAILLPVMGQAALTLAVLVAMGMRRAGSIKSRRQNIDDLTLATDADWEKPAIAASNNFKNQFEMPVLFYAVAGFALATRSVDTLFFTLACLFVLTRVVHAGLHLGLRSVKLRGLVFLIGVAILMAMWILLSVRVLPGSFA